VFTQTIGPPRHGRREEIEYMDPRLDGKIAVTTRANKGIGLAASRALLGEGEVFGIPADGEDQQLAGTFLVRKTRIIVRWPRG